MALHAPPESNNTYLRCIQIEGDNCVKSAGMSGSDMRRVKHVKTIQLRPGLEQGKVDHSAGQLL